MNNQKWIVLMVVRGLLLVIPIIVLILNIDKPFTGKWWWYAIVFVYAVVAGTIVKKLSKRFSKD